MATNTSQQNRRIQQAATRRRAISNSPVPGETTDLASPLDDRAVSTETGASASSGATMNSTRTHSPTPLAHALLTTKGAGPLPELLTLSEVCAFLKVKPSYVYSLTSTDRIPFRKFGGTLRFVKAELLAWLDRGRGGPR